MNGGRLADRALVATANVDANQQAIEITGQGSTVVLMGLAGPNDAVSLSLLSNLTQDKTIRFSWLYPLQWPTTIRLLDGAKVDTGPIITHTAPLDGISAAIERVLAARGRGREDGDHAMSERPRFSVSAGDHLPLDLRRGPRELPGGRRRGDRHLGVQARRGPIEGRRVGREAPRQRPAGDHVHSRNALRLPGSVPRPGRPGGTDRGALRGDRDVRAVRAEDRSSA